MVNTEQHFVEWAYMFRPVKAVELELPWHHCVAYLDLKREECVRLFPAGWNCSEVFILVSMVFACRLNVTWTWKMSYYASASTWECKETDLPVWPSTMNLQLLVQGRRGIHDGGWRERDINRRTTCVGHRNLFITTWDAFIDGDSPCFINGKSHLRAVVYNQVMGFYIQFFFVI